MSEISNLVQELKLIHSGEDAWHGLSLSKTLHGIGEADANRKPPGASHTICELVLHIGAWEDVFCDRIEGRLKLEPDEGDFPPAQSGEEAWQQALALLDRAHQRLIVLVSAMKDSDLMSPVPGKDFNIAFMLHGIVRHHVYHAGQIGLLRRLLKG